MLSRLSISNYALIDHLDIGFDKGFSVITGETGAGKSILLGALSLILGQRANLSSLGDQDKKAVVEGWFDLSDYGLEDFFISHDIDYDCETVIRREILPSGKSRAFVNDTPVSLQLLRSLGERLVDIHSQDETQLLLKKDHQRDMLDHFAGIHEKAEDFGRLYRKWQSMRSELEALKNEAAALRKEEDFLKFQADELEEAGLDSGGIAQMEDELRMLENAGDIRSALAAASALIGNDEPNALDFLRMAEEALGKIRDVSQKYEELASRLDSVLIELEDIRQECELAGADIVNDPEKVAYLTEQMDKINRLLYKHNAATVAELMEVKKQIEERLNAIEHIDDRIERLEKELIEVEGLINRKAKELSDARTKASTSLEEKVVQSVRLLGMKDAVFSVAIGRSETMHVAGFDEIEFLFSANKGYAVSPLSKVASGGERSRLMLVLKDILSKHSRVPTLILDEIDMGISGEVAAKTAGFLKAMSDNVQLIAITHLPQVAGKAGRHYKVAKNEKDGKAVSTLTLLDRQGRIDEIARLLSGESITTAARKQAGQLLK